MQIRTALGSASGTRDGTGAMAATPIEVDPLELRVGALADLLELLAGNGFDLSMAGGDSIEGGGEFVFSIKDEDRIGECANLLRDRGYRNVRVIEPQHFHLADRAGELARVIRELVKDGRRIDEIYIGTTDEHSEDEPDTVPVQITTIRPVS